MKTYAMCGLIVLVLALAGCRDAVSNSASADAAQARATEQSMREANAQIGMPAIINFQERKLAKMIFELRDKSDLVCYAYFYNAFEGKRGDFIGRCIGFGLPYSVQYTNPERVAYYGVHYMAMLPQADPNGLFMPQGLSATWLMLIDPDSGEPKPVYIEPQIIVSPFPLHKVAQAEEK